MKKSPLLYEYLKRYQEDPTSRIFAPLAELYRKAGLVQEAAEIASEGLRHHPQFVGGKVALARALFDLGRFSEVLDLLTPVVRDVPDNLVAQKLMGESALILGRVTDALGAFKMLLYFSPQDQEAKRLVAELENQAYDRGTLVLRSDPPRAPEAQDFEVRTAGEAFSGLRADAGAARLQNERIQKIEKLQSLLPKIERYRWLTGDFRSGTQPE